MTTMASFSGRGMSAGSATAFAVVAVMAVVMTIAPARVDAAKKISADEACVLLGSKLTSVSVEECQSLGLVTTGAYTELGRPILYKEYPPLGDREPNARVLFIGGVHGDEYSSFSVTLKWMGILDIHHSGLFHWRIAPALNLDGLLKDPAVRPNHNGVDLNRNMKTEGDWQTGPLLYWEKETGADPRRYPGASPLSENETQWLAAEIEEFKPDVIISVHAPYNIVDYDGPKEVAPPVVLGSIRLGDIGSFPGSLGRYAGDERNIPVLTIELMSSRYMPPDDELRQIWTNLVRWLSLNIRARKP